MFLSILGVSWFWLYGLVFLSQFPSYGHGTLGGSDHVVTLLLAVFSIDLAFATPHAPTGSALGVAEFLRTPGSVHVLLDLVLIGLFPAGGITPDGELAPFRPGIGRILEERSACPSRRPRRHPSSCTRASSSCAAIAAELLLPRHTHLCSRGCR